MAPNARSHSSYASPTSGTGAFFHQQHSRNVQSYWIICCARPDETPRTSNERRLRWRLDDPHYAGKSLDTVIEELSMDGTIVGTPDMIVEQINAYGKVGADELVLQWFDLDDIDGLRAFATSVLPRI